MNFDEADELLQIRASFGIWRPKSGGFREWCSIKPYKKVQFGDSREYQIEKQLNAYLSHRIYQVSRKEVKEIIRELSKNDFVLAEPLYPDLQQFFRNGVPITAGTILCDFIADVDDTKPVSPLHALMNAFETGK